MRQKENKKIQDFKLIKQIELKDLDKSKIILKNNTSIFTQLSLPKLENKKNHQENSNIEKSSFIKYNHFMTKIKQNSKYNINSFRKSPNNLNLKINIENEDDKNGNNNKNNSFKYFIKKILHENNYNQSNYTFDNKNSNMISVGTNTNNDILFQNESIRNNFRNEKLQKELIFKRLNNKKYFIHHYKRLKLINSKREEFEAKRRIDLYRMYNIVPLKLIQNKLNYKDYYIENNGIIIPKKY